MFDWHRTRGDPDRITRLVQRRTTLSSESIFAVLTKHRESDSSIEPSLRDPDRLNDGDTLSRAARGGPGAA